MDIFTIIDKRTSCRAYSDKEIPAELLIRLYDAASKAPSGGGFQAVSLIAVTDDDKKKKLMEVSGGQGFIAKAPLNLVFCIDYSRISRICDLEPSPFDFTNNFMDFWMGIIDASIMAHQVCLTAEALNLKSVYIGNLVYNIKETSQLLKLPKHVLPVIMLTLGYPKSEGVLSPKYTKEVLVHENEYRSLSDEALLNAYHEKNKNWSMLPKEKLIKSIYETSKHLKGQVFAESVVKWIDDHQEITPYQYWFGAYYTDEDSRMTYHDYVSFMKSQGFNWLE